jgi:hypothetical protein
VSITTELYLLKSVISFFLNPKKVSDELPEKIRIIFDSVKLRLISTIPYGHIDNCDAAHVAEDIHYLAGFMRMHCSRT